MSDVHCEIPVDVAQSLAETLNRVPQVTWDRFIDTGSGYEAYGWIDRDDDRADFVLVRFDNYGVWRDFTTSSARYSRKIHELLDQQSVDHDLLEHNDCLRVEYWLPDVVNTTLLRWTLCCNCGGIAPDSRFKRLIRDEDTEELRPCRPGESDPTMVCPHCEWHHIDDDSNPGIEDGTRAEVFERREVYLRGDYAWSDWWADTCEQLAFACICTEADDPNDHRKDCPQWGQAT